MIRPDAPLDAKLDALLARLRGLEGVLVAFSGGVDSVFLAAAAHRALGERAVAATAVSASLAASELADARRAAQAIGIRHVLLDTDELADPRYAANPTNRCYFCKSELFTKLAPLAAKLGLPHVVYGAMVDDRSDVRPGALAAREAGALAPLDEAQLTKAEIRVLSQRWDLATWDKPSSPCLSSRIPHGTPVTPERLARIERAEAALRTLGLRELRVRDHDMFARVELGPAELRRALEEPRLRDAIDAALEEAGFQWATLDPEGLRSSRSKSPTKPSASTPASGSSRPAAAS